MVDRGDAHGRSGIRIRLLVPVAGKEHARVVLPLHERVDRVSVRLDGGPDHLAVVVFRDLGLLDALRAPLRGFLPGVCGVRDAERDVADAVAVLVRVPRHEGVRRHRPREHVPGIALLAQPGRPVAYARLGPGVCRDMEAERLRVVVGGLPGVPHEVLHVVDRLDGHGVVLVRHPVTSALS